MKMQKFVAAVALAGAITVGTAGMAFAADGSGTGSGTGAATAQAAKRHPLAPQGDPPRRREDRDHHPRSDQGRPRAALKSGKSISEYATSLGKDPQAVVDALVKAADAKVDQLVANKRSRPSAGRHHQVQGPGPGEHDREPPLRSGGPARSLTALRAECPALNRSAPSGRPPVPRRRASPRRARSRPPGSAKLPSSNLRFPAPGGRLLPGPNRSPAVADFSLDLNEDQTQIQKWVHDFAEDVIRPAAHEWDEREETPWPIIEEAAKIGLYSMEFGANAMADPTGLTWPIVSEEMCWGDAGIALAIFGSTLAVSGILANGTPAQIGEWVPAVLRHPREGPARRVLRDRARRRQRRQLVAHARGLRRGQGRVGAERHQDVDHQRRHRRRPRRRRLRRAGAPRPRARRASSCPRARRACAWARSSRSTASAPATPPRLCSTTCASRAAACSAARRSSTSVSPAPAKA